MTMQRRKQNPKYHCLWACGGHGGGGVCASFSPFDSLLSPCWPPSASFRSLFLAWRPLDQLSLLQCWSWIYAAFLISTFSLLDWMSAYMQSHSHITGSVQTWKCFSASSLAHLCILAECINAFSLKYCRWRIEVSKLLRPLYVIISHNTNSPWEVLPPSQNVWRFSYESEQILFICFLDGNSDFNNDSNRQICMLKFFTQYNLKF